jgi:hypothetical protein
MRQCLVRMLLPLLMLCSAPAGHAAGCERVHLDSGTETVTVEGVVPHAGRVCFEFSTGAGRNASVAVTGNNVIFSIDGVIDAQYTHSFMTRAQTYRLNVRQTVRSVTDEPFTLSISLR